MHMFHVYYMDMCVYCLQVHKLRETCIKAHGYRWRFILSTDEKNTSVQLSIEDQCHTFWSLISVAALFLKKFLDLLLHHVWTLLSLHINNMDIHGVNNYMHENIHS